MYQFQVSAFKCPLFSIVENFRGLTIHSEAGGNTWELKSCEHALNILMNQIITEE